LETQTDWKNEKEEGEPMALTREQLEGKLIARVWEDDEFRTKLTTNPNSAVEDLLGEALPEGMKVVIAEESDKQMTIVIPPRPELESGEKELSEDQLEAVAGGGAFNVYSKITPGTWRKSFSIPTQMRKSKWKVAEDLGSIDAGGAALVGVDVW